MYSAYYDMLEPIYQNYYDSGSHRRRSNDITKEELYNYLTAEPYESGKQYFDSVPALIEQNFLRISEEHQIDKVSKYYLVYTGASRPQTKHLAARVVANITSQSKAVEAAMEIWNDSQNNKTFTESLYTYKIYLGRPDNSRPVKLDKIVLYNLIPCTEPSIFSALQAQMSFLYSFCTPGASLPHFVWQPTGHIPVGYGEGISHNFQEMTFSELRAECLLKVITTNETLSFDDFQNALSKEFDKNGLSGNIPFINKCGKADEGKWYS